MPTVFFFSFCFIISSDLIRQPFAIEKKKKEGKTYPFNLKMFGSEGFLNLLIRPTRLGDGSAEIIEDAFESELLHDWQTLARFNHTIIVIMI